MAGTSDHEDLLKTLVIDVAAALKGGVSGIPSLPTLSQLCSPCVSPAAHTADVTLAVLPDRFCHSEMALQ